MSDKRATRELERDLRRQPDNLPLRLRLAAAYRAEGRPADAVQLYRSVAVAYHGQRRLAQAIAVCKSVLELEPAQPETIALLAELERMRPLGELGETPLMTPAFGLQQVAPPPSDDATAPDERAPSVPPPPPPGATPPPIAVGHTPSSTATPRAGVRVLDQEVSVRDLSPVRRVPVRPVMVPATPPPRPGAGQLVPPPLQRPSTQLTPTPLPDPVPFHDAVDSVDDSQSEITVPPTTVRAPSRDTATDAGPPRDWGTRSDDLETRIAPTRSGTRDDAATRVAPPRPPTRGHHDDDDPTRIADPGRSGSKPAPLPLPVPARASSSSSSSSLDVSAELETRRIMRIEPHDLDLLGAGPPQTGPVPRLEPLPPPLPARQDSQSEDPRQWADEDTDPREQVPTSRDTQRSGSTITEETHTDPTDEDGEIVAEAEVGDGTEDQELPTGVGDEIEPSQLFEHSFVETLAHLGPDGTPLEGPDNLLGVFSVLPDHARADLERTMIVRHAAPGEVILREGDRGDSCYVIGQGEVRVLKSDPLGRAEGGGGEPIEVARLGDGSMFGEFALLADRRRHATVEAVTPCELYEVPRRALRELAATYPEVGPALERFYRERLLATLLATAPFFQPLPEEQRAQLLARFVPLRSDSGHVIVKEGERSGGLYLIVLGAVEIVKRGGDGRNVLLATLREGAYVGEMSLLRGQAASASVIAAGPVELAFLPPRDFYEVVAGNPALWNAMRREVGARQLENARILAGDTSAV